MMSPLRFKRGMLLICGIFLSAALPADECDQLPKATVKVKLIEEKLIYNTSYSYKSLTNVGAALARPGTQVLGLTRGNSTVRFESSAPSRVDTSGRWECISPQITVTYGISPITVYVAREFPQGSCAYKEILEHEMRHVKTYQEHVKSIEKNLTETLNARFAGEKPWRAPVGEMRVRLQRELDERWLPFVQREFKRVEEAQALIDTPAEYERVAIACDGEIKKRTR